MAPMTNPHFDRLHLWEKRYATLCRKNSNIRLHMPVMRTLASLCDGDIWEFGTGYYRSTVALHLGRLGRPCNLYSLDIAPIKERFPRDPDAQKGAAKMQEMLKDHVQFRIQDTLTWRVDGSPDMILIDDLHTYDQVKKELDLYGDRSQRFLAFHDITSFPEINPAIHGYIQAAEARGIRWDIIHREEANNGFLVLERRNSE